MSTSQPPSDVLQDLHGQVALVTGASSGIGAAIARALAERGAHVALAARRTERLQALSEEFTNNGSGHALALDCDVRDPDQVQAAVRQTLDHWGQLDILVANAGFGYRAPLVEGDITRWKDMIDTNVYGLLLTLKYGVAPMLERKRGHVVVTSSVAGRVPTLLGSAYCGSKFAATAIADVLRQEVGPQGVRVTTIEPGVVISEFQEVADYPPGVIDNMLKGATPLVPEDIARAVVFAVEQPAHYGVSEIVVRATGQAFP
ncbi:MAG TPA: SDR family oxidoreductase [Ktedonobacterales bacterium]|nr:SDR family oxidoreductase [Ktedonobacterales bacterium]